MGLSLLSIAIFFQFSYNSDTGIRGAKYKRKEKNMALDYTIKCEALKCTKEVMVAKMSNSAITMNSSGGKDVALFMEEIYNGFLKMYEDVYSEN